MSKYDELKRLAEAGLPACCGEKIPTGVEHGGEREMMCCEKWQQGKVSVPAFDLLELIAENERLAMALRDFLAMGDQYEWGRSTTGRQVLMRQARELLKEASHV